MNYSDFCKFAVEHVEKYLGDEGSVELNHINKNNGVLFNNIVIKRNNANVAPSLVIDRYYDMYISGYPFGDVMDKLLRDYESCSDRDFDMSFFMDYDKVKDRIIYKLINNDLNKKLLESVPHKRWNDLAIIFLYVLEPSKDCSYATIMIRNEHLKMWGIDTDRLYSDANDNTPRIMPDKIMPMYDIVMESNLIDPWDINDIRSRGESHDNPIKSIYVLTNEQKLFGASTLLYSEEFDKLSDYFKSGLYIIPSSIHEVIIVPSYELYDPELLSQMIQSVNETGVDEQEILSDSLYYYDPATGEIYVAL